MKPVETVPFNEILCFKNVDKLQSVSLQHSNPSWIHLYFHYLKVFVIVNSYYMLLLLHHSHQLKANQLQDLLRLYKWFSFSLFPLDPMFISDLGFTWRPERQDPIRSTRISQYSQLSLLQPKRHNSIAFHARYLDFVSLPLRHYMCSHCLSFDITLSKHKPSSKHIYT